MNTRIEKIPKLPPRKADSHKGTYGKVCIVAASTGFTGAAYLAGSAAYKSGAGLVRLAVPQSLWQTVATLDPCYTMIPLAEDQNGRISEQAFEQLKEQIGQNDVFAFGPGTGVGDGVKKVLTGLLQQIGMKMVIDADGLNCLAQMGQWQNNTAARLILTPHPGEMKRLWTNSFENEMPDDREKTAVQFAGRSGTIVVLKGHNTIVTDGKKIYTNTTGNAGMACGGTGDVLTGIITALLGQDMEMFDACVLGVYVHGLAGDIAAEEKGQISMVATDLIQNLGRAFREL